MVQSYRENQITNSVKFDYEFCTVVFFQHTNLQGKILGLTLSKILGFYFEDS